MGRRYRNSPLIEAGCEFRFAPGEPWDLAIPGLLYEKFREKFPKRRQANAFETTIVAGPDAIQQQTTKEVTPQSQVGTAASWTETYSPCTGVRWFD